VSDRRNYVGLELTDGYLYASSAALPSQQQQQQRVQLSRVRVDDGRIYQVNLRQEGNKLLCWLDVDDAYRQPVLYTPLAVNTIRVAGQDGTSYGFVSQTPFVGCIGAIHFNERDIIDYKYVPSERRQSCHTVVQPNPILPPPPVQQSQQQSQPQPQSQQSLGYINFEGAAASDLLSYTYAYEPERPLFEDISFIFRTTSPDGVLFVAHNAGLNTLVGGHIRDGLVHVVYMNGSSSSSSSSSSARLLAELPFVSSGRVDDGNLYRLNLRRNEQTGHCYAQVQSYTGVTALEFATQPGPQRFAKITVGGADEWSRARFFATRPHFRGCIIDLFQVNGQSVIRSQDVSKDRYNCRVEAPPKPPPPPTVVTRPRPQPPPPQPIQQATCSTWSVRGGLTAGEIDFTPPPPPPGQQPPRHAEINFRFNTSRRGGADSGGTLLCTRDEQLALKVELKDQKLLLSLYEVAARSAQARRLIKAVTCQSSQQRFNDNRWHRVQLVKRARNQVSISCDDSPPQTVQYDGATDLPFAANTNGGGVRLGADCLSDDAASSSRRKFIGELAQVIIFLR
jgi:hypothetical protein